ncbi:MAG: hypothetical protein LBG72_05005, partial [Spirochaetaceae bacterium]|nr:hypothetical protein [Spirochaetaceae bacterium]
MKTKRRIAILAAALAGAIFFAVTGCDNTTGGGGGGGGSLTNGDGTLTDAAFESHNTDYSILVRNNTSERLVAFKGD